jgi:flagellar basal body-associated protein FliL
MGWDLLLPKGWSGALASFGVVTGLVGTVRFSDTITIGSIVVASLVVVAGGIFSFRNNMRTFWRNLAEERQEQIKVLEDHAHEREAQVLELQEQYHVQLAEAAEQQRLLRHDLKGELASVKALLALEHSKTDLSALLDLLARQHDESMLRMETGMENQKRILGLLGERRKP